MVSLDKMKKGKMKNKSDHLQSDKRKKRISNYSKTSWTSFGVINLMEVLIFNSVHWEKTYPIFFVRSRVLFIIFEIKGNKKKTPISGFKH